MKATVEQPAFTKKPMDQMNAQEWEALCDGCGLCCLHRIIHPDSAREVRSNIACHLLDCQQSRCSNYAQRFALNPNCAQITPQNIPKLYWLPDSCAYKRVARGQDLPEWHYLVCGDREEVHRRGISKRGEIMTEAEYRRLVKYYDDFSSSES